MTGESVTVTKEDGVSSLSSLTDTESGFVSEDVYAETNGAFTRVVCKDVFAFGSIATSGDFSETVDSFKSLRQIGVEVEYPNGGTEVLVLQPSNLLSYPIEHRRQVLDAMFNEGEIWIGEFGNLFSEGLFPKSWETIVVPDESSVEKVFSYRDKGISSLYTDGKEEFSVFGGSIGLVFLSTVVSVLSGSLVPFIAGSILYIAFLKNSGKFFDVTRDYFKMDSPHLWCQRESCDTVDSLESMNESLKDELVDVLCGFDDVWTTATILNVEEEPSETTLTLFTEKTATEVEVVCDTPSDSTDRFLLNRLTESIGVGSVRMLEGEQVQVGLSSLGKEDDVTKNKTYRLRTSV